MNIIDQLLRARLFEEALSYLEQGMELGSEDYLFYLAYIQVHLGWTEEAMDTIYEYQLKYPSSDGLSTVSGFLADIYHNDGCLFDAWDEIGKALVLEPTCPLIQAKAEEIHSDLTDLISHIMLLLCMTLWTSNKPYWK